MAKSKEQVFLSKLVMSYIESEIEKSDDMDMTVSKIVNREMMKIAKEARFEAGFKAENAEGGL